MHLWPRTPEREESHRLRRRTQEKIDPVRYISNRSSGRQGYAIAKAAWMEGADVTLVSCTTALPAPYGVKMVYVQDARELEKP